MHCLRRTADARTFVEEADGNRAAYLAVASLLWELFTGEQGANFERHCRYVIATFQ